MESSLGLLGEAGKARMSVPVVFPAPASTLVTVREALAEAWPEAVFTRQVYRPESPGRLSARE